MKTACPPQRNAPARPPALPLPSWWALAPHVTSSAQQAWAPHGNRDAPAPPLGHTRPHPGQRRGCPAHLASLAGDPKKKQRSSVGAGSAAPVSTGRPSRPPPPGDPSGGPPGPQTEGNKANSEFGLSLWSTPSWLDGTPGGATEGAKKAQREPKVGTSRCWSQTGKLRPRALQATSGTPSSGLSPGKAPRHPHSWHSQ